MSIRRIVLLGLSLLMGTPLFAQDNYMRDSLIIQLDSTSDADKRLSILQQLTIATQTNLKENLRYADMLLAEAEARKNNKYKCEALFSQLIVAYNTYHVEEVQRITDQLLPLSRKIKNYDLMFRAWRCSLDFMTFSRDFERVEKETKRMLAEAIKLDNTTGILEAYQCLGNIYRTTFRWHQAMEILEKALPLAYQQNQPATIFNICQQLLSLYAITQEYPKWHDVMDGYKTYLYKLPQSEFQAEQSSLLLLYTSYLDYYTQTRQWEQAEAALKQAEQYATGINSPLFTIYLNRNACYYYRDTKQYEKALEKIDATLSQLKELDSEKDYYSLLPVKADLLHEMERDEEAVTLYKQVLVFNDSSRTTTINKQAEELRQDFNVGKASLDEVELRHRMQLVMLVPLSLGLLVVAGFIVYVLRSHRTLQKAEAEMRAMTRHMELVNDTKNRFLSNIGTMIRQPLNVVVEGSMRLATHQVEQMNDRQQLSQDIRRMSGDLLKIINDILDLSRLEAGMMKFQKCDAELSSLLYDAACATQTPDNPVEIRREYPENTLFMAQVDPERLLQLFKSLFTASEGPVCVTVCEQGKFLSIKVSGSVLAEPSPSQEIIIRNEINRMFTTHFGGSYTIAADSKQLLLTLPVGEVIRA